MIGTSPPKQNDLLSVMLNAKIVATAASAALPPFLRIAIPASTAPCPPAATAPCLPDPLQLAFCAGAAAANNNAKAVARNATRINAALDVMRETSSVPCCREFCERSRNSQRDNRYFPPLLRSGGSTCSK